MKTVTKRKHNKKPIGHLVQHLKLLFDNCIKDGTLSSLKLCCPFLSSLQLPRSSNIVTSKKYENVGYVATIQVRKETMIFNYITDNNNEVDITLHHIPNGSRFYTLSQHPLTELCLHFIAKGITDNASYDLLDKIHTSYSHLSKLSIINANFNHDSSSLDYKKPLYQWNNLKKFTLDNVRITHPFAFNYITYSYPCLESLIMKKIQFDYQHEYVEDNVTFEDKFGREMFNMFITLASSYLKHFEMDFYCMIDFWPNDELVAWIDTHYTELPLNNIWWPTTIIPSPNTSNMISFLHYLQTLTFKLTKITWDILESFLKNNKNNKTNFSSSNLQSLTLSKNGHPEYLPINFFDCLDIFPRLTTLVLNKLTVETNIEKENKKKEKEEECNYVLEKLMITKCELLKENAITIICKHCPRLNILHCTSNSLFCSSISDIVDTSTTITPSPFNYKFLYAPHIHLKELKIGRLYFFSATNNLLFHYHLSVNIHISSFSTSKIQQFDFASLIITESKASVCYLDINLNSLERFNCNDKWVLN
ncbi:unnamed protein product [Cunninghamella echinulata]